MTFSEEKYNKELADIFNRFPSVQNTAFKDAYKPGLDGMKAFARLLGNPQDSIRTVHVAGTNGKGSVSNMLAAAFASSGCRTGLYTSPHIHDFRERMRIDGAMVPKEYVYGFILRWRSDFERLGLSFFEITTGMALRWFADCKVDVAVIEVGLGGRLDSTNIITPELSIVTSIGLDHCDMLGDTLAAVASEKAGIFKSGVPALVGEALPETEHVFTETAAKAACELVFAERVHPSLEGRKSEILDAMDLRGSCQSKNLTTVLAAIDLLRPRFTALEDDGSVVRGIVHAAELMDFHGRWERISRDPQVICDIGHNAHALRGNFARLEEMMASGEATSLTIVYGVMADKDLDAILPLMPLDADFVFATPSSRRALPAERIFERVAEYRGSAARLHLGGTVAESVRKALEMARKDSARPLVYIGGSTFVVSEL